MEELANGVELNRGLQADDFIGFGLKALNRSRRGDGCRDDESLGLLAADGAERGDQSGTGCHAVVNDDDAAALQRRCPPAWRIQRPAAMQKGELLGDFSPDVIPVHVGEADVFGDAAVFVDGADGEFRLFGSSQFANEYDIEVRSERIGDNARHRNPATGDAEDNRALVSKTVQLPGQ